MRISLSWEYAGRWALMILSISYTQQGGDEKEGSNKGTKY